MEIAKSGSQPSAKGPADWFAGSVRIDSAFQRPAPARISGATVTFEPGARTAWHTHPLGQTLIVIARSGQRKALGRPDRAIQNPAMSFGSHQVKSTGTARHRRQP